MSEHPTEAGVVADLARKAAAAQPFTLPTDDGRLFLAMPQAGGAWTYHDISDPRREVKPSPHVAQAVTLQSLDSLVDYAARFKTGDTVLFADIARNRIAAAIDYHTPPNDVDVEAQAAHVAHTASMDLPHSVEWDSWKGIDGKLMGQLEFARFLEENAGDIVAPTGAELLEACRDIQAARKVNFIKAVRTESDNESFEFTDETTAARKGNLEIPTQFKLAIPVYFGEPATPLFAFLRWKLEDGEGLKLGIRLHRAEHVRQAVFKQIVLAAAERLDRPAVFGFLGARGG